MRILKDYFRDRKIIGASGQSRSVNSGVPQGSVLGPLLWNVLYDGLCRKDLGEDTDMVVFADDVMLISSARKERDLVKNIRTSMAKINE